MKLFARTCDTGVMDGERIAARLFVGLGGIIWIGLAIGSAAYYGTPSPSVLTIQIVLPIVLAVVAFVVGWFYENAAAVLLFAGAVATIAWGVVAGWEPGVWGLMALILIAPEIIAGLLFLMAAQMQDRCNMEPESVS
jgi:hypothetical protein